MKKTLLSVLLLSFGYASAQTFVSTTPENKKAVLEIFTGIYCGFCPQGQQVANTFSSNNPGNVMIINIHQGNFSTPGPTDPDFRTTFGNAIAGQTGLTGYPAGTMNRQSFTGIAPQGAAGTTALNRNNWTAAGNQVLAQSSYVNVAVQGEINVQTNMLNLTAEVYYTGSSPVATNKLNIAILQNNTKGPQSGGNLGSNYIHNRRLIHMLTGQWGTDITTTSTGSFHSQTFTYSIPAAHNGVPIEIGDLEFVAFVAEGQQNIVSGNKAFPTYVGLANNDVKLKNVASIDPDCLSSVAPKITIQNMSASNVTALPIQYSINNGQTETFNWTGNLAPLQSAEVTLPSYTFTLQNSNTLNVTLPSDDNVSNNTGSTSFNKAASTITNNLTIKITTDRYGDETTWTLKNSNGVTVASGGPYSLQPTNGAYPQPDVNVNVPLDCYTFQINDSYGDGMNSGYGVGSYQVLSDGVLITGINGGSFGASETKKFSVEGVTSTDEFNLETIKFYPNPTNGLVNISLPESALVTITDLSGKIILSKDFNAGQSSFNLENFSKGVYIINFIGENFRKSDKIILK
jgi:thiol-disulfide isomerase/thioredoxin